MTSDSNNEILLVDITDFPGYKISNEGEIFSNKPFGVGYPTNKFRKLECNIKNKRYITVTLKRDGKSFCKRVHRLVLEAFVGPCPPGMEGCHKDGNRYNNKLSNLRWGDKKSNWQDRKNHGRGLKSFPKRKLDEEKVAEILQHIKNGLSQEKIAKLYNVSLPIISDIHRGKRWAQVPRE